VRISRAISVASVSAFALGLSGCSGGDAAPAAAPTRASSPLAAHAAWSRSADSGATAAVYFWLVNRSTVADTLTGARSELAEETTLHVSMEHGGTMHMAAVASLPVPAKDSVAFQPLGAHVMLRGLRRPLVDGDTVALTLTFASGRSIPVRSGVRLP